MLRESSSPALVSMAHDVFISYSTQDSEAAEQVYQALVQAGLTCWIASHSVAPGQLWDDAIMAAIPQSRLVLLLVSAHAIASDQVQKEIERADHYHLPVLPVRLEDVPLTGSLEFHTSRYQRLDAFPLHREAALSRLVTELPRRLRPVPEPTFDFQQVPTREPHHRLSVGFHRGCYIAVAVFMPLSVLC